MRFTLSLNFLMGIEIKDKQCCLWGQDKCDFGPTKEFYFSLDKLDDGDNLELISESGFFEYGNNFPLDTDHENSYVVLNGFLCFQNKDRSKLFVSSNSLMLHLKHELLLSREYICNHTIRDIYALFARPIVRLISIFVRKGKPVVILIDRPDRAGDNAEALFKYIMENHRTEVRCYFAISGNDEDANRLKEIGRVIKYGGIMHKCLFMANPIIASSQSGTYRPFQHAYLYKDLFYNNKFIYLKHGITDKDMHNVYNATTNFMSKIITTTRWEYAEFRKERYGFRECQVCLTGLARFDLLNNCPSNKITVLLTWRKSIIEDKENDIAENFKKSDYYKIFRDLVFDRDIADLADKYGYTLQIMLHPNVKEAVREIIQNNLNDRVVLLPAGTLYRTIFNESNLIITDYSSVAFDFAYMRKPILYYQPDNNSFYNCQAYGKGEFDYGEDGLGEVTYNKDDLMSMLNAYLKNDCRLNERMRERIEAAFPYNDKNNCERIYKAMFS